jgi:hypothetical protein
MFSDFVGLPNLHTCWHLLQHARTFGTLTNTAVGTKEMVHRIFKNMVPHTNRKNVELDLLKRYTTLQSIRHLADGGLDPRFSRPSIDFIDISRNSKCLFKDWFIIEDSLDEDNEESEGIKFKNTYYLNYLIISIMYYVRFCTICIILLCYRFCS